MNWEAQEREEEDLYERRNSGQITKKQFEDAWRELKRSVREAYESDCLAALGQVDQEWGR